LQYIIKKIIILVTTLFLISLLTFATFNVVPGDPALLILGTEASPEKLQNLRVQLGTDKPLGTQYTDWLSGFVRGDFGNSIKYDQPVKDLIADRIPVTLTIALIALVIILFIGIFLGVYSAKKQNTLTDRVIGIFTMISISVPGFFLGILFIWIFGLVFKLFSPGQYVSYQEDFWGYLKVLFFPALAIAVPNIAILTKYLRSSVIGEIKSDYVRTAYGKGNKENHVLYGHVLKNAMVGVVPLIGMMVGDIFSGSIIVEQVFGLPGIGRLLISSITSRDFPLTQTLVVYIAAIVVIANFMVDIIIQIMDPRIRVQ